MSVPGIRRPMLGRRRVGHRRQQAAVDAGAAQQRHRAGRGAVAEDAGGRLALLRDEPGPQAVGTGRRVPAEAAERRRIRRRRRWRRRPAALQRFPRRPAALARLPGCRQQHGAAVEVELPGAIGPQAVRRQQADQGGRRVVRVVRVAQCVPLAAPHDRAQRVVLQQQDPGVRQAGAARSARLPRPGRPRASCRSSRRSRRPARRALRASARGRRAGSATIRRAGCRTRWTVLPARSRPAAPARPTASAACATSAAGSAPLGSSGTVGSATSCARPQRRAQPHLQRVLGVRPWILAAGSSRRRAARPGQAPGDRSGSGRHGRHVRSVDIWLPDFRQFEHSEIRAMQTMQGSCISVVSVLSR